MRKGRAANPMLHDRGSVEPGGGRSSRAQPCWTLIAVSPRHCRGSGILSAALEPNLAGLAPYHDAGSADAQAKATRSPRAAAILPPTGELAREPPGLSIHERAVQARAAANMRKRRAASPNAR